MNESTRAALARSLGAGVSRLDPLAGGDINEAFRVQLSDGRRAFAKTNSSAPPALFEAEARGLRWLAQAQALRVPEVLALGMGGGGSESPFLVLEWVEPGARGRGFEEQLGRGLADLHRAGAPAWGLEHDNFIGPLPQSNLSAPSWAEFYRERRLCPLWERARRQGLTDAALDRTLSRLLARLEDWVGPREPPARLHGDLWGGNLLTGAAGDPVLIDPAVYGGHREVDLAMMRLFGGFGARVFDAYAEHHPLAEGHHERVALYQLYPLLVHLVLFGASYQGQVRAAAARYA